MEGILLSKATLEHSQRQGKRQARPEEWKDNVRKKQRSQGEQYVSKASGRIVLAKNPPTGVNIIYL